jgi:hypothetical protein
MAAKGEAHCPRDWSAVVSVVLASSFPRRLDVQFEVRSVSAMSNTFRQLMWPRRWLSRPDQRFGASS